MGGERMSVETLSRVLAVVTFAAGIVGVATGVWWWAGGDADNSAPDRGPAVVATMPSTVAPRPSAEPATTVATTTTTPVTATTTIVSTMSPSTTVAVDEQVTTTVAAEVVEEPGGGLGDLLPPIDRGGALPPDAAPRPVPTGMQIDAFDVTGFPIREVGLQADGELEVPSETEIGWYRYGATAGEEGATVLAAHVSWNGTTGPFFELGSLELGAQVEVSLDDDSTRLYEVVERARYEKNELPRERIWRNTGPETLVLITCGGDFNPEIQRFRHNIVVYAVPVG